MKQSPLVTKENVLGHMASSCQVKRQRACENIPSCAV